MAISKENIPSQAITAIETLHKAGFEAYLVGGCVRDLILGRTPKDWDATTNATPEDIQGLFPHTVYENNYGTVLVIFDEENSVTHETVSRETPFSIEITPFRLESGYSDNRHPDSVTFSQNIEDDLKRRDFTINALAYNPINDTLKDIYGGIKDMSDRVIRTVGLPDERFSEDALRILRAIRFSTELGFAVSHETLESIAKNGKLLESISKERIRDEFTKMILSTDPVMAIGMLEELGLLQYIVPELREGIGCEQKGEHIYDVFEHLLHALGQAAKKEWPFHIRIAALFHDIGKPRTRRWDSTKAGGKGKYTFYGHEVVGARMTRSILERLKYPKETIELVTKLVRYHMFFSDTEQITLSAVRRIVRNVGPENIWDLMKVRECDRVGMKKVEAPYRLRKYHAMIEEVLRDPISVGQLAIDGNDLKNMDIAPGRRMGWILHALLEEVLDDPSKNTREHLGELVKTLNILGDPELKVLGERGKEKREELEEKELEELHKKHNVKK